MENKPASFVFNATKKWEVGKSSNTFGGHLGWEDGMLNVTPLKTNMTADNHDFL